MFNLCSSILRSFRLLGWLVPSSGGATPCLHFTDVLSSLQKRHALTAKENAASSSYLQYSSRHSASGDMFVEQSPHI
ncbi:hypothetical protein V8C26DRAFT_402360, partial [Trichoderma gracile]